MQMIECLVDSWASALEYTQYSVSVTAVQELALLIEIPPPPPPPSALFHHCILCPSPPRRLPLSSLEIFFLLLISPCVLPALLDWFPLKSPSSPPPSSSRPPSSSPCSSHCAAPLPISGRTNSECVESVRTDMWHQHMLPDFLLGERFLWNVSPAPPLTSDWIVVEINSAGDPSHSCLHFTLD